jgi:hypothetical protein
LDVTIAAVKKIHLPERRDAWRGGFVIDSPDYISCVAAVDGTVVAAGRAIYRLRPGDTRFQRRDGPEGMGDISAVAVEPRRPGRTSRFACGCIGSLHIYDAESVASVEFPGNEEVVGLMWAPAYGDQDTTPRLYVRRDDGLLRLEPDGGPLGAFGEVLWPIRDPIAMARDDANGIAFAQFDEETDDLDLWLMTDLATNNWGQVGVEAPPTLIGCVLAVAGRAVAVAYEAGGVWITRDVTQREFREVEELQANPDVPGAALGRCIAFGGATDEAPLFCTSTTSKGMQAILRVDADGRVTHLADVTKPEDEIVAPIRAIAWDATRRTLWAACGEAGVLCLTEPGAPVPIGVKGGETAAS